eukprot:752393-Hanusia_phi.AAC.3
MSPRRKPVGVWLLGSADATAASCARNPAISFGNLMHPFARDNLGMIFEPSAAQGQFQVQSWVPVFREKKGWSRSEKEGYLQLSLQMRGDQEVKGRVPRLAAARSERQGPGMARRRLRHFTFPLMLEVTEPAGIHVC